MKRISRRDALSLAVLSSVPALPTIDTDGVDFEIIGLGRRFDAMAAKLDFAIDRGFNIDWSDLKEFGRIVDQIIVTPATTIEGLCVKARVGCWGLLGDLDDPGEETPAGERISLSIRRDLIRLRHPDLERPGALTKLVRESEETAVRSSANLAD